MKRLWNMGLRRLSGCLNALVLGGLGIMIPMSAHAQVSAQDGSGQTITLAAPAQRIISLSPHATELLFSAGAGAQLVGRSAESDYPPAALKVPSVGRYGQINPEILLRLRPDLVVIWQDGAPPALMAALKRRGIPVFLSHPLSMADIGRETRALGTLSGHPEIARTASAGFDAAWQKLHSLYGTKKPVPTLVLVGDTPLFTVGNQSFLGQMVNQCGGQNVFADLKTPAAPISAEAAIKARPQLILSLNPTANAAWRQWPLPANRRHAVFTLHHAERPSLRLLDAMIEVCGTIDAARQ